MSTPLRSGSCLGSIFLALALLSCDGLAQSTVPWALKGRFRPGDRPVFVHDVDKDGTRDFLAGTREQGSSPWVVNLVSGKTRKVIRSWTHTQLNVARGLAEVIYVGDFNGDKVKDFLFGNPTDNNYKGSVVGIDGKTLMQKFRLEGKYTTGRFGSSICLANMIVPNKDDKKKELIIGSIGYNNAQGRVDIYGFSKLLIPKSSPSWTLIGAAKSATGAALGNAGDLDGRPGDELIVGARGWGYGSKGTVLLLHGGLIVTVRRTMIPTAQQYHNLGMSLALADFDSDGAIEYVFGEQDRARVWQLKKTPGWHFSPTHTLLPAKGMNWGFGQSLWRLPDLSNDRTPDLAIIGHDKRTAGTVHLYTGGFWTRYSTIVHGALRGGGGGVASSGDLDGDLIPEVLVGGYKRTNGVPPFPGLIHVFSQTKLQLTSTDNYVNVAKSESVTLKIDMGGPAYANRLYIMVGSLSGRSPGIRLGTRIHLPLNPDSFFWLVLQHQNISPFENYLGFLDSKGIASPAPRLQGSALLKRFMPLRADYAAVIFGAAPGWGFAATTNAVRIKMW